MFKKIIYLTLWQGQGVVKYDRTNGRLKRGNARLLHAQYSRKKWLCSFLYIVFLNFQNTAQHVAHNINFQNTASDFWKKFCFDLTQLNTQVLDWDDDEGDLEIESIDSYDEKEDSEFFSGI